VSVAAFGSDRIEQEVGQGSRRVPGAARRGRGGTVYLADVGELDARGQAALLAVLERLSTDDDRGVRTIAGSDGELRRLAEQGHFRAELYSRLAGFEIRLPTLRACPEDIGLLVRQLGRDNERARLRLSTPALRHLLGHPWPFNREQLHACLTAASMLPSMDAVVGLDAVRDALRGARQSNVSNDEGESPSGPLPH
jgi:transcriptional regulator of acetoin/glycerol metabolism